MRFLVILIILLVSSPCHSRLLWEEDGFKLQTVGWLTQEVFQEWIGIKTKLHIPPGGYAVFEGEGALEFFLPCKNGGRGSWVKDIGIIVGNRCDPPTPDFGRDTRGYRLLAVNEEDMCEGWVRLIVLIPRINPIDSCIPTSVRWVGGYCDAEE